MKAACGHVVYQHKEIHSKRARRVILSASDQDARSKISARPERISPEAFQKSLMLSNSRYRLIRKMPAKIVTIPTHCQRETCSFKKKAASPTVTAPYSEPRTVITATCSILIPKFLMPKAPLSKTPIPRTIQHTSPRGRRTGCFERRIAAATSTLLVKRINHTV